jgi:hypothetical protein
MRPVIHLTALSAVLVASCSPAAWGSQPTSTGPATRLASCIEPLGRGHTVDWWARYTASGAPGTEQIRVVSAGSRSTGGQRPPTGSERWVLSWAAPTGLGTLTVTSATSALPLHVIPSSRVALLSPDRNCSLLLSAAPGPAHPVAVIGDSVFAIIARAPTPPSPSVTSWQINAQSGDGWGSAPVNWPLGVVRGTWAIALARGIFTQHPSALVVELGTNDAIRAVFADGTGNPALGRRILTGVAEAVSQLLTEGAPEIPCTVLVTASTHETGLFGQGLHYSDAAGKVNAILRAKASEADGKKTSGTGGKSVLIADWGALAAPHHLAEGAPGNWFTPGDDIHPNAAGQRALLGLIQRVVKTCPHR